MYIKNQPINHSNKLRLVALSLASLVYMTSSGTLRTSVEKKKKLKRWDWWLVRWVRG